MKDFEPYACFTRMDRWQKGVINSEDIVAFLMENSMGIGYQQPLSSFECNYIIKYFDSTFQGYLNYQDFCQVILPCDNMSLRLMATENRPQFRTHEWQYLSPEVEARLCRLLEREILFHLRLE